MEALIAVRSGRNRCPGLSHGITDHVDQIARPHWLLSTEVVVIMRAGYVGAGFVASTSATAIGFLGGSAWAGNWNTSDNAYKAGDANVVFHQCDLAANTHDAFHDNDSHDVEPSQLTTLLYHGCTTDDVRINDSAYGTGSATGWYECHVFHSSQNCDQGHAHINTSYSNIPEDYKRTLTLVCEEIGHSVGLAHRVAGEPESCMGADLDWLHLSLHDIAVINNNY